MGFQDFKIGAISDSSKSVMGIRLFQENGSLSHEDLILYFFYKTFFVRIKNI